MEGERWDLPCNAPTMPWADRTEFSGAWQIDLETGQLSPWEPPLEIQNQQAGLVSPDGGQVALVGETGLTLVNADGTDRREDRLTYPYIPQMEGGGFIAPVVAWAADSQSLAAITYSENVWEFGGHLHHLARAD